MRIPYRFILVVLLAMLALNSFGGGLYGMMGAKDIPTEWLEGSGFQDYFIPSLILFVFVGGSAIIAAIAVFKHHIADRKLSFLCAGITGIWILVQIVIIGYVSFLQPLIAMTAILILILANKLPKHEI